MKCSRISKEVKVPSETKERNGRTMLEAGEK
jgi:hypothetical protein